MNINILKQSHLVNPKEESSVTATADDLPTTLIKVLFQFKRSGRQEIDEWL